MKNSFEEALSLGKQMVDNNPEEFELIILGVVDRIPAIYNRYKDELCTYNEQANWRDDFLVPGHNALYKAIQSYHNLMVGSKDLAQVSEGLLRSLLTMQAESGSPNIGIDEIDSAIDHMRMIREQDMVSGSMIVLDGIERWLKKRRLLRNMSVMMSQDNWDPDSIVTGMMEDTKGLTNIGKVTKREFGYSTENKEPKKIRIPIPKMMGLTTAMGGGFTKKEHTMFIAPTGGGKTVMACGIAVGLALQKQRTLLVTTEQGDDELEPRIISANCDVPFERIKDGVDLDTDIPSHAWDKYQDLKKDLNGYFWYENWNEDRSLSVMHDLKNLVTEHKRIYGGLDVVVLDWIGGALGSMSPDKADFIRMLYQMTADYMDTLAKEEDLITVSFAQANIMQSKNKKCVDHTMLAECKSMGRNANFVFGISALENDSDGETRATYRDEQWCHCSKGRKSNAEGFKLLREFHFQRFANI